VKHVLPGCGLRVKRNGRLIPRSGLSTGDFRPALESLLGAGAAGLSPTAITRPTAQCDQEYQEPKNLGSGWVGFDFEKAFRCPVKLINDAALQAQGSYEGGRMLFLGLGTGLGSAMIADHVIMFMELAHLPYKKAGHLRTMWGAEGGGVG